MSTTIVFLTDNSLDERLAALCRRVLIREADGLPIISVSQKPIDFGRNVCVGEIGRSRLSLYRQTLAGLEAAETEHTLIAEHDVLYSSEHLHWTPPDGERFWFNRNVVLLEGPGTNHPEMFGAYSDWPGRVCLSQLVCSRELHLASVRDRLWFEERGMPAAFLLGEPGAFVEKGVELARAQVRRSPALADVLECHLARFGYQTFATTVPNVDIRHGSNWTGPRRGRNRRYDLPYWGKFADLWESN
jgi:hypothetical protein